MGGTKKRTRAVWSLPASESNPLRDREDEVFEAMAQPPKLEGAERTMDPVDEARVLRSFRKQQESDDADFWWGVTRFTTVYLFVWVAALAGVVLLLSAAGIASFNPTVRGLIGGALLLFAVCWMIRLARPRCGWADCNE